MRRGGPRTRKGLAARLLGKRNKTHSSAKNPFQCAEAGLLRGGGCALTGQNRPCTGTGGSRPKGTGRSREAVNVWVNGEARTLPEGSTLSSLLALLELGSGPGVAVEVNAEVVRRARHPEHRLQDGDRVEIVTFVGGG
nr:sulfur carrier protein ThiS [Corallococcus exiguus]